MLSMDTSVRSPLREPIGQLLNLKISVPVEHSILRSCHAYWLLPTASACLRGLGG
jgi:hypothetical protein